MINLSCPLLRSSQHYILCPVWALTDKRINILLYVAALRQDEHEASCCCLKYYLVC
jgi:hypothetical protein